MTLEMAVAPIAWPWPTTPTSSPTISSLRYIMWGATPVTESVAEAVTARTGVRWLPAYGASELPVIACNPVDDPAELAPRPAAAARRRVELRVADLDTGDPLLQASRRDPGLRALGDGGLPARLGQRRRLRRRLVPHRRRRLPRRGVTPGRPLRAKDQGLREPVAPAEIEAVLHGHLGARLRGLRRGRRAGRRKPVAAVELDPAHPATDGELRQLVADSLATHAGARRS